MSGPSMTYATSENAAYNWIFQHFAAPGKGKGKAKGPNTPAHNPNASIIDIPDDLFLYESTKCNGRTVEQPLYKLPPAPPRAKDPFSITWAPQQIYDFAPQNSGYINTMPKERNQDDDPALALHDFEHQFHAWNQEKMTASADTAPNTFIDEILKMGGMPNAPRIAISHGLKNGMINVNNTEQMQMLMTILQNSASVSAHLEG